MAVIDKELRMLIRKINRRPETKQEIKEREKIVRWTNSNSRKRNNVGEDIVRLNG